MCVRTSVETREGQFLVTKIKGEPGAENGSCGIL